MEKQPQKRKYSSQEKAELRKSIDTTRFKVQQDKEQDGTCIPPYPSYTSQVGNKAPAWDILTNNDHKSLSYPVQDAMGNTVVISLDWLVGFIDGEGTLAVYLNRNPQLWLGFQIQPVFVIVPFGF
jgi:hypothetical protein